MISKIIKSTLLIFILLFISCENDNTGAVVSGTMIDVTTLQPPVNVYVALIDDQGAQANQILAEEDGSFKLDRVMEVTYTLQTFSPIHKKYISEPFQIKKGDKKTFKIYLIPKAVDIPIGFLEGTVTDTSGAPLKDVLISVGSTFLPQTNGYFSSTITNANGYYMFGVIPLHDTAGDTIQSFAIRAIKEGFKVLKKDNISVNYEKMTTTDIELEPGGSNYTIIYEENFEDEDDNFNLTGFWHKQHNASILNKAYRDTLVKLAPNDNSSGYIPNAYRGSNCLWYGEESTGNFMGTPKPNQSYYSGGTGVSGNYGIAISPLIDLTKTNEASLDFWSYWEIESVNPNAGGFDWMYVSIATESNPTSFTQLLKLNPYIDPYMGNRASVPYTSGGFNFAPIWSYNNIDLSQYAGKKVYFAFTFSTNDGLYNGFRGWFIDNIRVVDIAGNKSNIDYNTINQIPKRRK